MDALCHRTCVHQLELNGIASEYCFPDLHGREVDSKVSEAANQLSHIFLLSSPSLSLSLSISQFSSLPFLAYFLLPFPSILSIHVSFSVLSL